MGGEIHYDGYGRFSPLAILDRRDWQAPGFYGVIAFATLIGYVLNLIGMNPIRALYYTTVLNGIAAPPLLFMIMLISNDRQIMKSKVNGPISQALGWLTTVP